jgi:hypothetical protein
VPAGWQAAPPAVLFATVMPIGQLETLFVTLYQPVPALHDVVLHLREGIAQRSVQTDLVLLIVKERSMLLEQVDGCRADGQEDRHRDHELEKREA